MRGKSLWNRGQFGKLLNLNQWVYCLCDHGITFFINICISIATNKMQTPIKTELKMEEIAANKKKDNSAITFTAVRGSIHVYTC